MNLGYIKHQFEFESENGVYIPFSIISVYQNNNKYFYPSSVEFSSVHVI